jgi:hypothetical protein
MTDTSEDAAELIVKMIMDSLGANRRQRQALLQAYCQIELRDYPTMISANLTSEAGRFIVAGGRVKVSQQQAVWHARKSLAKMAADPAMGENLKTVLESATSISTTSSPYHQFVHVLYANAGVFLGDVSS